MRDKNKIRDNIQLLPPNVQQAYRLRERAKQAYYVEHDEAQAIELLQKSATILSEEYDFKDEKHDFRFFGIDDLLKTTKYYLSNAVYEAKEREWDEISESIKIICPICNMRVPPDEDLHSVFANNKYAEIAANLVRHYRDEHISYFNAAQRNSAYTNKIPNYDYDEFKKLINNRAKRQMIRSLAKKKKPDDWQNIIAGFAYLQHNDDKTLDLIEEHLMTESDSSRYKQELEPLIEKQRQSLRLKKEEENVIQHQHQAFINALRDNNFVAAQNTGSVVCPVCGWKTRDYYEMWSTHMYYAAKELRDAHAGLYNRLKEFLPQGPLNRELMQN